MRSALANVLLKVFANGFYRAHAGMFCFVAFVMFGMVEPGQLLNYHITLMLAFMSSPLMMGLVFLAWLLYTFKCWHFVAGQVFALHQQFLFYSSTSYQKSRQFSGWFILQGALTMPLVVYGVLAIGVGIKHHIYLGAFAVLIYLLLLIAI